MTTIVSVAQNKAGGWMVVVDGSFLGDSRPQATRELAIEYARKIAAKWQGVEFKF